MDPEKGIVEKPTCKICFGTAGLITHPVCDCIGSVGHICLKCLRESIRQVSLAEKGHVDEETGYPLCPDCHAPYRNIDFDRAQDDERFLDYIQRVYNWSRGGTMAIFGIPSLSLMGVTAGYLSLLSSIPEGEEQAARILTVIYLFVAALFAFCIFGASSEFYEMYANFRDRRPTGELQINPSRHPILGPRPRPRPRPRNQDVVIEMEKFLPIQPTPPAPPSPVPMPMPRPQPPIEQQIPERPQFVRPMQFRPNELSRRGRRWSAPQLQRQPQPSARQHRSHTPRRSLQQQPRSRHQRRQQ